MTDDTLTRILIDNTTFAAAGRYSHQYATDSIGAEHARDFWRKYPKQKDEDRRSFQEFLTALVLFDRLYFDGSSYVQEYSELNQKDKDSDHWIYRWFEKFEEYDSIFVQRRHSFGDSDSGRYPENLLSDSRIIAMNWVKLKTEEGWEEPDNFRLPEVYNPSGGVHGKKHVDLNRFSRLNKEGNYNLDERELGLAMFLHRGLFYRALSYSYEGFAYMPHSYRGMLLDDPDLEVVSKGLALQETPFDMKPIHPKDIMDDLGKVVSRNLEAINIKDMPARIAIGRAFFQGYEVEAFEWAMKFRESDYGVGIRESFRDMVAKGTEGNVEAVRGRVEDFNSQLLNARKRFLGTDGRDSYMLPEWSFKFLKEFEGVGKTLARAIPREYREDLTSLIASTRATTGPMVLFSYYIPGKRILI